jgi:dienelactone hydrolase
VFTKAPILFLHGDADDYTPIGACQDYADKIGKAGTPVEFVVLKGAHHKFDGDDQKRYYLRGAMRTKAECVLEVDIDTGYFYDRTTGARLRGEAYTAAHDACRAVGASVEGNHGARDKAAQAELDFLNKTYAN